MSNETKQKTAIGKFLQNIIAPIIKGGIKSVPFVGNIAVDIIENVTKKDVVTGEAKHHNPYVLVIEVIGALTLAYLVVSGKIPVEKLIEFIQSIA